MESFQEARTASDRAWTHLSEASAREARQKDFVEQLQRRATAAKIAFEAAGHAIETDYAEVLQRIAHARERLDQLHVQEKELRRRYHDTEVAVTRVDERLRNRTEMLTGRDGPAGLRCRLIVDVRINRTAAARRSRDRRRQWP